jgi:hypothetical protein
MPDKDDWRDLMREGSPPHGVRVEVKGQQNSGGRVLGQESSGTWIPYQSAAVLTPAGWIGDDGGDHLNMPNRYRLTHWRPLQTRS